MALLRALILLSSIALLSHCLPNPAADSPDQTGAPTPSPTGATSTPTPAPTTKSTASKGVGFLCAGVAVFFFGTNFVPVKKFESGDGMFFQFIMCCGVFTVGHVVNAIQGYPKFEPFAMLGGFLWAFGNLMAVPIIKMIGMGLGLLIWGATNMMIGWGTGTFGWFDLEGAKRDIAHPWLNYVGFGLAVASLACYLFVEPPKEQTPSSPEPKPRESQDLDGFSSTYEKLISEAFEKNNRPKQTPHRESTASESSVKSDKSQTGFYGQEVLEETVRARPAPSTIDSLAPNMKRLIGVAMAVVAGCLFGATFNPPKWVELHKDDSPQKDIDYVFAHFCGIWLTSLAALLVYVAYLKNEPFVFPKLIGPAFTSGVMWGIAQTCWFIANDALGFSVAFPIICTGPGLVSAFWGITLFGEIRGKRNFIVLGIACFFTLSSSLCIALSS